MKITEELIEWAKSEGACAEGLAQARKILARGGELEDLAASYRGWVAARTVELPPGILEALVVDPNPFVRGCVAERKTLPEAVLTALAADRDRYVRGCVATRTDLPETVLAALARDSDQLVRWRVAEHR